MTPQTSLDTTASDSLAGMRTHLASIRQDLETTLITLESATGEHDPDNNSGR